MADEVVGVQVRDDTRTPNLVLAEIYKEPGAQARRDLVESLWYLVNEASLLRAMLIENRPGAFMLDTAEGIASRAGLLGESVKAMVEEEAAELIRFPRKEKAAKPPKGFGSEPAGIIPKINALLLLEKTWDEIGKAVHMKPDDARKYFEDWQKGDKKGEKA
jgi:hypothetical protein